MFLLIYIIYISNGGGGGSKVILLLQNLNLLSSTIIIEFEGRNVGLKLQFSHKKYISSKSFFKLA